VHELAERDAGDARAHDEPDDFLDVPGGRLAIAADLARAGILGGRCRCDARSVDLRIGDDLRRLLACIGDELMRLDARVLLVPADDAACLHASDGTVAEWT